MKNILILLSYFFALSGTAQDLRTITIVDSNNQPIPFVKILLSETKWTVSDLDGNFVTKNINQDSVITFSHSAYYLKSLLVRDIKDSVSQSELNVKHITWNNLFVKNVSHKQLYKLPVNSTFKTDFTFQPNFIVVFNDNEMKEKYYPMNHQANYNMNSFSITNQFPSIKADSFNPYGVQKPSQSIVTGSFDYLFDMIGK